MRALLLICICLPFHIMAQRAKIDSLNNLVSSTTSDTTKVKLYKQLALAYENIDLDSSRIYALIGYDLSLVSEFPKGQLQHLSQLVFICYRQSDIEEGLTYTSEGLELAKKIEDEDNITRFLNMAAVLNDEIGNYPEAMIFYNQALSLAEQRKDSFQIADVLGNIGVLHYQMGDFEQSIDYYEKDLKLRQLLNDVRNEGRAYSNLSSSYGSLKQYQNSAKFARKALNISEELGDKYDQIYDLHNLGQAYINLKKYDLADGYMKATIELSNEINDYSVMSLGYKGLGDIATAKRDFESAKINYFEALKNVEKSGNKHEEIKILASIVYADSLKGDFKSAFATLQTLKAKQDSLLGQEKVEIVEELQAKYDTEKKDNQIAILKVDNELKDAKEKQSVILRNSLIVGSILLLVLFLVTYNRYRIKQKSFKIIEKRDSEKQLLIKEIHHRVKNNLQIVLSLLNAQANILPKNDTALAIIKESQNRIKSLALIHQDLYQSQSIVSVNAKDYFEKLLTNVQKSFTDPEKSIDLNTNIESVDINMTLSVPLGLILNELVTNSYKYAFENKDIGSLSVSFRKNDDQSSYQLKVSDDGHGMPNNSSLNKKDSFGLELVNGLASQLNGSVKTRSDQGTEFDITVRDVSKAG